MFHTNKTVRNTGKNLISIINPIYTKPTIKVYKIICDCGVHDTVI